MFESSAAALQPVATYVLLASCKGTAAIAFVLLCRTLLARRIFGQTRHALWLVVIASLLLPLGFDLNIELPRVSPQIETHSDVQRQAAAFDLAALAVPAESATADQLKSKPALSKVAPTRGISYQSAVVMLWAAVVVLLAALTALNLLRYLRIAARAKSVTGPAGDLLIQCAAQVGVHRVVRLRESADIDSPAIFGWRSPLMMLPTGLQERFNARQLRHVFLHELSHVKRHDILVNWFMSFVQILHWFNPLVWYGLRVMRSDMEQACDARVLRQLLPQEHNDYGLTLIGVIDAFPRRALARGLAVVGSQQQLKERISMIANFRSRKVASPVMVTALLLAVASMATTQPRISSKSPESSIDLVSESKGTRREAIVVSASNVRKSNLALGMVLFEDVEVAKGDFLFGARSAEVTDIVDGKYDNSTWRLSGNVQVEHAGRVSHSQAASIRLGAPTGQKPSTGTSAKNSIVFTAATAAQLKVPVAPTRIDSATVSSSEGRGASLVFAVFQSISTKYNDGTGPFPFDPEELRQKLLTSINIDPSDSRVSIEGLKQLVAERRELQTRNVAAVCARKKELVTGDEYVAAMLKMKADIDAWMIGKSRELQASPPDSNELVVKVGRTNISVGFESITWASDDRLVREAEGSVFRQRLAAMCPESAD